MDLFLPEILEPAAGLSLPLLALSLAVGVALWLFGWASHRFWVVLGVTVLAGVFGLQHASLLRIHPVAAALLLAVAAGILGLSLMRIITFLLGGIACLLLVRNLLPTADAPIACVLIGGILATLLFRLWLTALTSFVGTLLFMHAAICLVCQSRELNVIEWTEPRRTLLNWSCLVLTGIGFLFQLIMYRRSRRRGGPAKKAKPKKSSEDDGGESRLKAILLFPFRQAA